MANHTIHRPNLPLHQENKVIDVVDIDDDDDVRPVAAPQMNHIVVPSGQLRVIPASQLQQQGLTYAVVSSANNVAPGMNRVLIARPQAAGQIFLTRNVNGVVTRAPQVICYDLLK